MGTPNSMGINWSAEEKNYKIMEEVFLAQGKQAISMNHYDLADVSKKLTGMPHFTPSIWKSFLTDPRVAEYINNEFSALQNAELRKIIIDINSSKSVGQAQIINSLVKLLNEGTAKDESTAYIYCYIPLNDQQAQAENVHMLDSDPFIVSGGAE